MMKTRTVRRAAGFFGPVAAVCVWAATAWGQGAGTTGAKVYPDSNFTAENLLRSASGHARDGQWAEAIDIYARVIAQYGDTMARVPKDDPAADPTGESQLWVDARQHCQHRLAAMPPEARELYRKRVDAQAERWYRRAASDHDRAPLRRLLDEAFCSSWGDEALELLGDLAFQDGQFAEALAAYRRLVPDGDKGRAAMTSGLVYPDPDVDPARVAAKKLLARAAIGENPPTGADLEAFRAAYPDAKGALAGRRGLLADDVAGALADDRLAMPAQPDGRWPTFAGSSSRSHVAPGTIDIGDLQWRVELRPVTPPRVPNFGGGMRGISQPSPDRGLAYHPIVLGDQVVVCDENAMMAYQLGARPETAGPAAAESVLAWDQKLREHSSATQLGPGMPRFTLTASGDRVFARLGPAGGGSAAAPSVLVAVRNNREVEGKRLWDKQPSEVDLPRRKGDAPGRAPSFEGSPVADARSVYIGLTVAGTMTSNYVACLDTETGATRWARYLFDATSAEANNNVAMMGMPGMGGALPSDVGGRLLSLDGPTLYYQTNMGALAALDAETGQIRWLATYPHREPGALGGSRPRDLNPAVVHDGLVIVAPDDSPRVYAFDAASGRVAWKSDRDLGEVAHVLGVAKGRLVLTGDHVWSLDVKTGKILRCWPDGQGLEGYGRGVLAGESIYWPTKGEIQVLDQANGMKSDRGPISLKPFGVAGGNLAVGDGYLIVAGEKELVVFCQNSRLIRRYQEELVQKPDRTATYLRLASVAEATGQDDLALDALRQAARRAKPSETFDGRPAAEQALDGQHRLLMKLGARASAEKDWAGASRRFAEAAQVARVERDRLAARLRLAEAQAESGDTRAAVDTLQAMLSDARLPTLAVPADADRTRTVRADLLVADRLESLLKARGRAFYAAYDRAARELLEEGRRKGDAHLLEAIGRTYPVAEVAPEALLVLAELHAEERRPAEAARVYKRLLASSPDEIRLGRATFGLARAYEAQDLLVPARDLFARVLARHRDVPLSDRQPTPTLGALAAARLASEPFDKLGDESAEPDLPVPLVRRWDRHLDRAVRPLAADGTPPSPDAGRIYLAEGRRLRPVRAESGQSPWSADLGGEPAWVGYLADRVLAATSTRVVALALADGQVEWRYPAEGPDRKGPAINPFAGPEDGRGKDQEKREAPEPAGLSGFRVVGGRVVFLRGDRELIALDGDTGRVDWSYAPASGHLNPHAWIGPRRAVLQSLRKAPGRSPRPSATVVLETERGRTREYPQAEGDEPWARDPLPIDDDHVALAVDSRTITLFDLDRGRADWTYRDRPVLPRTGAPLLLGDSGRLLALYEGNELVRLDPATGDTLWSRPLGQGRDDLTECPSALALDAERLYCVLGDPDKVNGAALTAHDLADGSLVWRRHLSGPTAGWVIALTERCVAAYPSPRRASGAGDLDGLPLVLCRRDDGAPVQRLVFPATVSDLAVRLAPRGALVATQADLWSFGERPPMDGAKGAR